MRRASLLLAALVACAVPAAAPAASTDAAVDEYFGPFHMSALQIRMKIGDLGRRYHARTISDHDLIHDAAMDEAALRIWRNKYPKDTWLAPTAFHLEQLYQAVQSDEARKHARSLLAYIDRYFHDTKYGTIARLRIAQGFPPLHEETVVVASPSPRPLVTVPPSMSADAQNQTVPAAPGAPAPSAVPASSAAPGASPSATASAAPATSTVPIPSPAPSAKPGSRV
jgi:hypothetical protein